MCLFVAQRKKKETKKKERNERPKNCEKEQNEEFLMCLFVVACQKNQKFWVKKRDVFSSMSLCLEKRKNHLIIYTNARI